ncbi:hypothetical protein, partial [Streptosporangium fragile]|uniref:class III lanthionine synthetase LanKC N-terminal domain-containing protein n=1 Tax=Streptosporangium fragile TaxID=46186 RepID=UPI0031EED16F
MSESAVGGVRPGGEQHLLEDVVRAVLEREASRAAGAVDSDADETFSPGAHAPGAQTVAGWGIRRRAPWTYLTPPDAATRDQGWKLHVS